MGELKVVAMDMDGTLLTASQDILPYTRKVLMQLQQQGVSLLLASGRDIDSLQKIGQKFMIHLEINFIKKKNCNLKMLLF